MHIGYWWEARRNETILKWILERRDGVDWMDMAQDRAQWRALVNTVLNLRVPLNAGKFLRGCTIGGSSRRAQLRKLLGFVTP
jgi:hypothetical protein